MPGVPPFTKEVPVVRYLNSPSGMCDKTDIVCLDWIEWDDGELHAVTVDVQRGQIFWNGHPVPQDAWIELIDRQTNGWVAA